MISHYLIQNLVEHALREDIETGDITAELISPETRATAQVITREPMILCGIEFVKEVFFQLDPEVAIHFMFNEGEQVKANAVLFEARGRARALLTAERTALNFLQFLSGTATTTHSYVNALKGTKTQLLDTRKTIPLFRAAQKYAVQCGGGRNHRLGLFDAFLIKENHILACGSITQAVTKAHETAPGKPVEVEVETLAQLEEAIHAKADIVMLDNFNVAEMEKAVALTQQRVKLEVSGNVTRENIREIANTGVDYISVGSLTKHVKAIDLSMRLLE